MLDPSWLWKLPLMAYAWWVRKLGAKTVLAGVALVTVVTLLFGWWESYR
jgi:hypothetical protein